MSEYEEVEEVYEEEPPPRRPWLRENWWWPLLALLLFVALLIGFFVWRDMEDEEATGDRVTVPEVVGLDEAAARERIRDEGLEPEVARVTSADPDGRVIAQEPGAGVRLERGQQVRLTVSAGGGVTDTVTETETETVIETATETETQTETTPPEPAAVPDVVGLPQVDAGAAVENEGLIADSYPVESTDEAGIVVAQNPDAGTELDEGSRVRMNVSIGPDERGTAEVPDVTGLEEAQARDRARRAGFTVRTIDRAAPAPENVGEVILQRPEPTTAPQLSQITIYVGR